MEQLQKVSCELHLMEFIMSERLIDEEVTFYIYEKRYRSPYQPVPSASGD
jgi:hypothetical protein